MAKDIKSFKCNTWSNIHLLKLKYIQNELDYIIHLHKTRYQLDFSLFDLIIICKSVIFLFDCKEISHLLNSNIFIKLLRFNFYQSSPIKIYQSYILL